MEEAEAEADGGRRRRVRRCEDADYRNPIHLPTTQANCARKHVKCSHCTVKIEIWNVEEAFVVPLDCDFFLTCVSHSHRVDECLDVQVTEHVG